MSFKKMYRHTSMLYIVLIYIVNAVAGLSLEYIFDTDESLKTSDNFEDCRTEETAKYCQDKCGPKHACLLGQCFCIQEYTITVNNLVLQTEESSAEPEVVPAKVFEEISEEEEENPTYLDPKDFEMEPGEHQALRHHIAHFCPNLNIARRCIRRCMRVGKPAFCGKDHACYCGHRYDTPTTDPKVDPKDTYRQFRDLYEKYFGPEDKKDKKKG